MVLMPALLLRGRMRSLAIYRWYEVCIAVAGRHVDVCADRRVPVDALPRVPKPGSETEVRVGFSESGSPR